MQRCFCSTRTKFLFVFESRCEGIEIRLAKQAGTRSGDQTIREFQTKTIIKVFMRSECLFPQNSSKLSVSEEEELAHISFTYLFFYLSILLSCCFSLASLFGCAYQSDQPANQCMLRIRASELKLKNGRLPPILSRYSFQQSSKLTACRITCTYE